MSINRNRLLEIARWEYMQKVRSKGFVISLVVFPIIMLAFSFLPSILASQGPDSTRTIGIVDRTGELADAVASSLTRSGTLDNGDPIWVGEIYSDQGTPIDSAIARAEEEAREETTEGYLEISGSSQNPTFIWRSPNLVDMQNGQAVRSAITELVTGRRISEAGIDVETAQHITAPVPLEERKLTDEGESETDTGMEFLVTFFSAFIGLMLFMILIMTTGQTLVRGLVEEKSNRIMEILVGAATPSELMWGKLIGLSGLGLTQAIVWVLLGGIGVFAFVPNLPIPPELLSQALAPLPWVALYLGLGYFFFAAIFIGVGSLVTTEQEAQFVTQYLTMILVLPLAFAVAIIQDPNASYVEWLSYVPLFTPTLMMLRVVASMPSAMTIISTIAVLLLSTVIVTWISSKIFRTAILLYGKRPSVREVLRWVRA